MAKRYGTARGITEGVIWKEALFFFFPILFGTFFQQLYNTADAVIVGKYVSKQALSAVGGSTATYVNLLVGFFVGCSSGGTVLIGQYFGARDYKATSKALHTTIALSIVGGAFFMAVGLLTAPFMLKVLNTPEDVMPHASAYLNIYFIGMIPNMVYNFGSGILRALGDSRRPLYFLIVCCIANIILDLFFVIGLDMGVKGVAWATILSQTISAVMVVTVLVRSHDLIHLDWKQLKMDPHLLKPLFGIGVPAGLQSVMYSIANLIIHAHINLFGTDVVAAGTAFSKVDSLFWMLVGAFGITCSTFVAQNIGAKKLDRVYKSIRVTGFECLIMSLSLSVILWVAGPILLRLFTSDANVLAIGMELVKALTPWYFTFVLVEIISGTLRAAGDSFTSMIITATTICVFRVIWVYFIAPLNPTSYLMIWYCFPVSWVLSSVVFWIYFKTGRWLKKAGLNLK